MSNISDQLLQQFVRLFGARSEVYYRADPTATMKGQKVEARYLCVLGSPTEDYYRDHLEGGSGMAIVLNQQAEKDGPFDHVNRCAVDIDDYRVDPAEIAAKLDEAKLRYTMTTSKSGGVHVHFFFAELVPAKLARDFAKQVGGLLGVKCEAFPKQDEVDEDNVGNGLNLCYHGDNRNGWSPDGPLPLEDFLQRCEAARISRDELASVMERLPKPANHKDRQISGAENMAVAKLNRPGSILHEGPPCLQSLIEQGAVESGSRNEFIYNIAVFAKKTGMLAADQIQEFLEKANAECISPPLDLKEIKATARSVATTGGANYKCGEDPICGLCNKGMCRTRRYGVASDGGVTPWFRIVIERPDSIGPDGQLLPEDEEHEAQVAYRIYMNDFDGIELPPIVFRKKSPTFAQMLEAVERRQLPYMLNHTQNQWNQEWRACRFVADIEIKRPSEASARMRVLNGLFDFHTACSQKIVGTWSDLYLYDAGGSEGDCFMMVSNNARKHRGRHVMVRDRFLRFMAARGMEITAVLPVLEKQTQVLDDRQRFEVNEEGKKVTKSLRVISVDPAWIEKIGGAAEFIDEEPNVIEFPNV